jgi:hypothetical protein
MALLPLYYRNKQAFLQKGIRQEASMRNAPNYTGGSYLAFFSLHPASGPQNQA